MGRNFRRIKRNWKIDIWMILKLLNLQGKGRGGNQDNQWNKWGEELSGEFLSIYMNKIND
jgi:hypothetical protein